MPTDKTPTSYRLDDEVKEMIARLAKLHGVSATAVVGMAVRALARRDLGPKGRKGV
jgi:hypothetical protein